MQNYSRRDFVKFLGYVSSGLVTSSWLASCANVANQKLSSLTGLKPSLEDNVKLIDSLSWKRIISWKDSLSEKDKFGYNNDYINYLELSHDELLLWVNNEYINPLFVSGEKRTKENIDKEIYNVGGSIIHLKMKEGHWSFLKNSKYNRRVSGFQEIPFSNSQIIKGRKSAMGTLGNCAGGKTPWGTILTCEENYDYCYGERKFGQREVKASYHSWEKFYKNPPEHYGWVVEVDLRTGKSIKRVEMGRFAHESATVIQKDGVLVVYSGDDKAGEHLYKFVSASQNNLEHGTLYVADLTQKKWLPLDVEQDSRLKSKFKTQLNVLMYTREAAKLVGATPLDRPEDIKINPITGDVFIALTNNKKAENYHGTILKVSEHFGEYDSLIFDYEDFLIGGKDAGFSSPDNLAFDKVGNLFFATDISGRSIGKKQYSSFGNNGLFFVPAHGHDAGKVIQIGSAPVDAEFTGLCFDPSGKRMFLSVQHPGEQSKGLDRLTSTWPHLADKLPRPSVIEISGSFFS